MPSTTPPVVNADPDSVLRRIPTPCSSSSTETTIIFPSRTLSARTWTTPFDGIVAVEVISSKLPFSELPKPINFNPDPSNNEVARTSNSVPVVSSLPSTRNTLPLLARVSEYFMPIPFRVLRSNAVPVVSPGDRKSIPVPSSILSSRRNTGLAVAGDVDLMFSNFPLDK